VDPWAQEAAVWLHACGQQGVNPKEPTGALLQQARSFRERLSQKLTETAYKQALPAFEQIFIGFYVKFMLPKALVPDVELQEYVCRYFSLPFRSHPQAVDTSG
jgi:hypothetical protein